MYGYDQLNGNNYHEQRIKTQKNLSFGMIQLAKLSSGVLHVIHRLKHSFDCLTLSILQMLLKMQSIQQSPFFSSSNFLFLFHAMHSI